MQTSPEFEELGDVTSPEITASIVDRVTFASHQNDIAVIADLAVKNPQAALLENLELAFECEPPLIGSRVWKIDRLSPEGEIRIHDRSVPLAGALLSDLNERMRAEVKLTLRRGGTVVCEKRHDLIGLAKNEWGGADYMPELLAAFVMPNDPAVSKVLKQAGDVLRQAGEQPALDGYQSRSRQRVWQMVSAIWTVISSRRLVYAEPPASFEREGQKIRTPGEILDSGLATCLDSTVLFAAALEQAGLNPIIALTTGHALCGVWLQPQQLPALTADDCADLRKYIALKELVLFETTLVVNEPPIPFSKAVAEADRRISEEHEREFAYALDVKRARRQQITPLGTIVKRPETEAASEDGDLVLGLEAAPVLPAFDLGIDEGPPPDTPETRLDHWKRKLLDLTKRNRLLNLKPSKTAIRLHCSDPAVLEDRLAEGKKITVIPMVKLSGEKHERDNVLFINRTGDDFTKRFIEEALERDEIVSDMPQSELDVGMVELYRKARSDLQEGGANTLYLALGILKWKQSEHEERTYRAPLILVPVKLERRSAASPVKIVHHEDEPVFNLTLLEMLRQDFELRLPGLEGELPKDHAGIDVPLIWETVRKAVRDMPGFEVVEEIVLSTFSFAKYLMWKDLADRTEALKQSPFVRHLIDKPRDPYEYSASFLRSDEIDEKINPADLFMPLYADSSQIVAVHASTHGGDFVLEGPPGTGKSQTIANIIAHNLALGRKVLFVSEKMAALEVVYRRLREKGLGDFCLELHSNKANKRYVLDQLGQSWHNRGVHTQAEWHEEAARLTELRNALNGLVNALHTPGPTGVSPRAAIGRAARWQDLHRFRLDWTSGLEAERAQDKAGLAHLEQVAKRLGQSYGELDTKDKAAFADIQQTDWSHAWQSRLVQTAQHLVHAIERMLQSAAALVAAAGLAEPKPTLSTFRGLMSIAETIPLAATRHLGFALGPDHTSVLASFDAALAALETYRANKARLSCVYPDDRMADIPVEQWQADWERASARPWPLRPIQCWLLAGRWRKNLALSARPEPVQDLPLLIKLKSACQQMNSAASELPADAPWRGLETDMDKAKTLREGMARFTADVRDLPDLHAAIKRLYVDGQELLQPGMPLADTATAFIGAMQAFEDAFNHFIQEAQFKGPAIEDLPSLEAKAQGLIDLQPRINAWCRWQAACREAESSGLGALISALESGIVASDTAEESFKTAYCLWLANRLIDDRLALKTFSALEHEEKIKAFRELDQRVADLSIEYIRARLSGDIPAPEDQDRPAGYGILSRELQKKMRHKPVRQLVAEMGDVLTALTPCLLMSPLSVSQFLSTDSQLFDLVVFDEASQITVWDAIGAIARGKNVIVVGDPKQMPPTSFFDRAASDGEEDENSVEDLESILDEAMAASIKLHRLTGHYRSRHESLIAFSNHRYYGGELVTYPSSETKQSAVSLVKVEGLYQRGRGRTNPDEAKAIVREVVRRLNDPELSTYSIGIVALNAEQQRLIDDLLDQERRQNPDLERFFRDDLEEPVFVKNLETVQGDQRDVILLSIGYGPDTPGANTMSMNFGPLNRKGGQRRLNVAITRAASEVIIFASFDPSMIDLTRTSAEAVRDLKHYMEFAQRGPAALGESLWNVSTHAFDSDFEEAVAEALRKKGWRIHTQIGVSKFRIDLGIVHPDYPGRYLAGIECDGATYHRSPSARDRDRIRHAILENLGWRLVRIWSTDYWIDPVRTIDRTHQCLTEILETDREKAADETAPKDHLIDEGAQPEQPQEQLGEVASQIEAIDVEDAADQVDSDDHTGVQTTRLPEAFLETLSAERFYDQAYLPVIEGLAGSLIDRLGPITFRHLSTKIARAHGFQKTGSQIKKRVWAAISKNRRSTRSPDDETVFWPENTEIREVVPFRGMQIQGEVRAWQDVPYPEKLGLAVSVLQEAHEDPVSRVAAQIGLGRLRQATKAELEKLLQDAKSCSKPVV
jgi:very-short-patch-repair endonuclease